MTILQISKKIINIYKSMDINTTVQQFHQLVQQFNGHKDFSQAGNKVFKVKEKQLVEFSKNVNSLPVSLIVLENSNDISPLYFASQFVKDKLKYQFQQLSTDVIQDTHSRIVALIRSNRNWSKIIRNNFALCLTYLYIHCYDKLDSVFIFYCKTFQISDILEAKIGKIQYEYLFRYLDGLACEIDNKRLIIDQLKRNQAQITLKNQQKQILMYLHHIYSRIQNQKTQIFSEDIEKLLFCFSEWTRMGTITPQVIQQLHNHSVFKLALSNLTDMQLSEAAQQCILNAIQQVGSPSHSPKFYEFLGKNLFILINPIMKQIKDEEYDQAQNFVRVLCEYGKHAGKTLIQNFDEHSLKYLQKMIFFTEDPMLQVFKDISDFWQEMIFFIETRHNVEQLTKQIADEIIVKLYQTYCNKIMYNNTQISQLNQLTQKQLVKLHQSVEDIRDKRDYARFIFQSIANYLKHQNFMNQVIKLIVGINKNQNDFWSKLQAYVYSIRDSAKKYVQPTPEICNLILYFQSLNDKPIILLKSILRVYQSLLDMDEKNEEFILRILNNIAQMFDKQLLDQKTGRAFEKCCQKNAQILVKHLSSIYQLLNMYPNKDSILVGLTHILKKNPSILTQNLPIMLSGPLGQLKLTKSKKEQRLIFNKLFTIIECIPKGQSNDLMVIIQMLFQQMWPIIQQIISDPQDPKNGQDKLIQRAIKFVKLVMRSIPEQFLKYLTGVFGKILESYRKFPINSLIYIYEVAFTVYYQSTQAELVTFLKQLYIEYCNITYVYLAKSLEIDNFEHLIDDFVGLSKRIITFDTRMFFESGQVQAILKFSMHCLGSGNPRAASTASQLFQIIFMIYWSPYSRQQYLNKDKGEVVRYDQKNENIYAELKNFILPNVTDLIIQMFKFLELGFVQSARDNILDCFLAIALAFPKESGMIWSGPLDNLDQDILTITQKERFKENLMKIGSNVHTQFLNAEYTIGKLLYTMASRFLYRKSRVKSLSNNL